MLGLPFLGMDLLGDVPVTSENQGRVNCSCKFRTGITNLPDGLESNLSPKVIQSDLPRLVSFKSSYIHICQNLIATGIFLT